MKRLILVSDCVKWISQNNSTYIPVCFFLCDLNSKMTYNSKKYSNYFSWVILEDWNKQTNKQPGRKNPKIFKVKRPTLT